MALLLQRLLPVQEGGRHRHVRVVGRGGVDGERLQQLLDLRVRAREDGSGVGQLGLDVLLQALDLQRRRGDRVLRAVVVAYDARDAPRQLLTHERHGEHHLLHRLVSGGILDRVRDRVEVAERIAARHAEQQALERDTLIRRQHSADGAREAVVADAALVATVLHITLITVAHTGEIIHAVRRGEAIVGVELEHIEILNVSVDELLMLSAEEHVLRERRLERLEPRAAVLDHIRAAHILHAHRTRVQRIRQLHMVLSKRIAERKQLALPELAHSHALLVVRVRRLSRRNHRSRGSASRSSALSRQVEDVQFLELAQLAHRVVRALVVHDEAHIRHVLRAEEARHDGRAH